MNYIEIDLSNPDSLAGYDRVAGKQGESNTKGVRFNIPVEYSEWDIYVETENANSEARRYQINRDQNNIAVYKFRKKDLEVKGKLLLDLVLEKEDKVFKPFSGEFAVKFAICATDDGLNDVEIDLTGYALKTDIYNLQSQITSIPKFSISVVSSLPVENISNTTVYLLKETETDGNFYTEYIYVNGAWECLGSQQIDLSNYRTKDESVPASEVSYTHPGLADKSGTVQGALDEAVDYVISMEDVFVKRDNISTEIEAALETAKESGEFDGNDGLSAYQIWLKAGNTGTEAEYIESLKGEPGKTPIKGTDYFTEADKSEFVKAVFDALPKAEEDDF